MSRIKLMNFNGYGENFKNKYKSLTAVGRFYILFYCHIFLHSEQYMQFSFLESVFTVSPMQLNSKLCPFSASVRHSWLCFSKIKPPSWPASQKRHYLLTLKNKNYTENVKPRSRITKERSP